MTNRTIILSFLAVLVVISAFWYPGWGIDVWDWRVRNLHSARIENIRHAWVQAAEEAAIREVENRVRLEREARNAVRWQHFKQVCKSIIVILLISLPIVLLVEGLVVLWKQKMEKINNLKEEFQKLYNLYTALLAEIKNNPNNPDLQQKALHVCRTATGIHNTIKKKYPRTFNNLRKHDDIWQAPWSEGYRYDIMAAVASRNQTIVQMNPTSEIEAFANLHKQGILTGEEFEQAKIMILKTPSKAQTISDTLNNLHQLKERGVLTESEFRQKKWDILA